MKKTLHIITLLLITGWSTYGQNFIQITQSDLQHQISLDQNQALEVRLPSTPSTGFGWYLVNNKSESILKQIGNWEFIADSPNEGTSGTQINHFVSVAPGTTDLELLYKRPWEDASEATASYKVTIVSQGAYTGAEVKPYIPAEPVLANNEKNESTLAVPAAFTWVPKCTPPKDQKSCGSCWTFASCGAFEAVVNIWDNKVLDMSEQYLVNCDKSSSGCNGGTFGWPLLKSTGCVYETDEPYKAADGTCKSTYTYHEKGVGSGTVTNNLATIKQALMDRGPMYVSVCAGTNFQNYNTGILTQTDGTSTNHAVLLCGWDDNGGTNGYWIIKNSWGSSWGEKGYLRAKYGISGLGQKVGWIDYKGIIPNNTTDIIDIKNNSQLTISPNPSSGVFTFSGLENYNTIEVYDFVGNLVYQTGSKDASMTVDMKDKGQGMYIYKVVNTNGIKTGKLMMY